MKVAAFEVKDYEKKDFIKAEKYNLSVESHKETLTIQNAALADGCEGVTTLGMSNLDAPLLQRLHKGGVKYIATRTVGYNHIDIKEAKKLGIRVGNAQYAPYNVADFTVMLILMLLRKAKVSVCRALVNDFSLDGMNGREMRSLTVGVIGAGKIGRTVVSNLSGFGCKILCYDPYIKPENIPAPATAAGFDELIKNSDVVTLHIPLTDENRHMIDEKTIAKMKDGALLVNTARGGLVDTDALITAIETGKIGGAGIDTIEDEEIYCHIDHRAEILSGRKLFYIKQFPNVIYTPHYAFFTDEAASAMVESALSCLSLFESGKENPYEIR